MLLPFPHPSGALLLPGLLPRELCGEWLRQIEQRYATLNGAALAATGDFSPHSSSLRLRALPQIPVSDIWAALRQHPDFLTTVRHALGPDIGCAVDECWVRRQYAPGRYPPRHAPHSWHQDGALGFDFMALGQQAPPLDALLEMLTCWVALTDCGDTAPGLELIAHRNPSLLLTADLAPEQVARRFAEQASWRPLMSAGDALLLCGDVLHRTHVGAAMLADRTSIELRLVPESLAAKAMRRPVPGVVQRL